MLHTYKRENKRGEKKKSNERKKERMHRKNKGKEGVREKLKIYFVNHNILFRTL